MRAFHQNSEFLRKARRMELGDRAPRKNTGAAILFFARPVCDGMKITKRLRRRACARFAVRLGQILPLGRMMLCSDGRRMRFYT